MLISDGSGLDHQTFSDGLRVKVINLPEVDIPVARTIRRTSRPFVL